MNFKGTFSVNITPTDSKGDLNLNSLKKYLNWQIQKKIGGLIILGSTGEFLSISSKNRVKMIRESVSITEKRVPLLVGTAAENTYDAIKFSVEAQKLSNRPENWRLACQTLIKSSSVILTKPQSPPSNLEELKKISENKKLPR